jgi:hypothetical protein
MRRPLHESGSATCRYATSIPSRLLTPMTANVPLTQLLISASCIALSCHSYFRCLCVTARHAKYFDAHLIGCVRNWIDTMGDGEGLCLLQPDGLCARSARPGTVGSCCALPAACSFSGTRPLEAHGGHTSVPSSPFRVTFAIRPLTLGHV